MKSPFGAPYLAFGRCADMVGPKRIRPEAVLPQLPSDVPFSKPNRFGQFLDRAELTGVQGMNLFPDMNTGDDDAFNKGQRRTLSRPCLLRSKWAVVQP